MSQTCSTGCTRPTRDVLLLCDQCAWEVERALADVPDLVDELTTTLTRQSKLGGGNGKSKSRATPLPYDVRASDRLDDLRTMLGGWTRVIVEDCDQTMPAGSLRAMARFLRSRADLIAKHEAAADIHEEITTAVRDGWRAVDRPAMRLFAGICLVDDCDATLRARPGAVDVVCPKCGITHDVAERRATMRADLDGMLCTAAEIGRLGLYFDGLDRERTKRLIMTWERRGRIVAHGRAESGAGLFPFGETITAVLAAQGKRERVA